MNSPITYYRKIKNEQHIFIYCVAGRSSSTAFQRIINSSNKVWIWGEPHHIIDEMVALINFVKKYHNDVDVKESLVKMYNSYTENKHLDFYPNAIGNLDSTIDLLSSAISNFLKPWAPSLKRFGFKEIRAKNIETLFYLKEIFPQSFIVFCFRNPIEQWPSVKACGWWHYAANLDSFLKEYYRLSTIYLEFAKSQKTYLFVENNDLKDPIKIGKIIQHLNIPKIDSSLVDVILHSAEADSITVEERELIIKSDAYKNYMTMQKMVG